VPGPERDPRLEAIPDVHGHAKGEHKPFAEERPIPYTARVLFLWFYHACRRGSPRFMMVSDHINYLTFEDPAAVNLVRRALKLAHAGDLYGAAETAGVEVMHAQAVSEGLRRGMRYSIGAEVDNDPRNRPDAQNIVDAMRPDAIIRSIHFLTIDHPELGAGWQWPFDNPEFEQLYESVGTEKVWDLYMTALLEAIEKLPGHIVGHFYVPAKFGHWPDDETLERYEDQLLDACAERGMAIEINTRAFYRSYAPDEEAQRRKYREANLRLLRKAKAKGVAIAIGSDAHSPRDQGGGFEIVLEMLDAADVNEIAFPVNGRMARVALRATEEILEQQRAAVPEPQIGSSVSGLSRADIAARQDEAPAEPEAAAPAKTPAKKKRPPAKRAAEAATPSAAATADGAAAGAPPAEPKPKARPKPRPKAAPPAAADMDPSPAEAPAFDPGAIVPGAEPIQAAEPAPARDPITHDPAPVPEPKAESKLKAKPKPKPEPKLEAEPKPQAEPKPEAEPKPQAEPKPEAEKTRVAQAAIGSEPEAAQDQKVLPRPTAAKAQKAAAQMKRAGLPKPLAEKKHAKRATEPKLAAARKLAAKPKAAAKPAAAKAAPKAAAKSKPAANKRPAKTPAKPAAKPPAKTAAKGKTVAKKAPVKAPAKKFAAAKTATKRPAGKAPARLAVGKAKTAPTRGAAKKKSPKVAAKPAKRAAPAKRPAAKKPVAKAPAKKKATKSRR
jgi:HisJ family histidinol phosphate phosphatase